MPPMRPIVFMFFLFVLCDKLSLVVLVLSSETVCVTVAFHSVLLSHFTSLSFRELVFDRFNLIKLGVKQHHVLIADGLENHKTSLF